MRASPNLVCLPDPPGECVVHLARIRDGEVVHEETLGVRTRPSDARVHDETLKIKVPDQSLFRRPRSGESPTNALERDRRLRHRVLEGPARFDQPHEPPEEIDCRRRLPSKVIVDGPDPVTHGSNLTDSSEEVPIQTPVLVRVRGFEPPWACAHTDLNRARLPDSATPAGRRSMVSGLIGPLDDGSSVAKPRFED